MALLAVDAWPIWVGFLILGAAAIVNARTMLVPNWLTLGGILSAWVVATLASAGAVEVRGGLGGSFAATFIGFGLLIPWSSRGYLGEGCVKAQMAFGAWLGCAADIGSAVVVAVVAGLAGSLVLGVAFGAVVVGHSRDRPSLWWLRFPAQLPLSVGSVAGAVAALPWV